MRERFWARFALDELTTDEWEALCDGCGRCCLLKLQDEETDALHFTAVACRFLDLDAARCQVYPQRFQHQPECIGVTPALVAAHPHWLPPTCAYRLVAEGKPLYDWHPLISGDSQSPMSAGMSVAGRAISEDNVPEDDLQEYVIRWVE